MEKFFKMRIWCKWRDVNKDKYNFLITWSARLDIYQKWGDSMIWRYYYYRLHPFSLSEILNLENDFSNWIKLNFKDKFFSWRFTII